MISLVHRRMRQAAIAACVVAAVRFTRESNSFVETARRLAWQAPVEARKHPFQGY